MLHALPCIASHILLEWFLALDGERHQKGFSLGDSSKAGCSFHLGNPQTHTHPILYSSGPTMPTAMLIARGGGSSSSYLSSVVVELVASSSSIGSSQSNGDGIPLQNKKLQGIDGTVGCQKKFSAGCESKDKD